MVAEVHFAEAAVKLEASLKRIHRLMGYGCASSEKRGNESVLLLETLRNKYNKMKLTKGMPSSQNTARRGCGGEDVRN